MLHPRCKPSRKQEAKQPKRFSNREEDQRHDEDDENHNGRLSWFSSQG
jgi:hypothetical protein